MMVT
jgi:hypothetical protein